MSALDFVCGIVFLFLFSFVYLRKSDPNLVYDPESFPESVEKFADYEHEQAQTLDRHSHLASELAAISF